MFSAVGELKGLEYPFVSPAEICLLDSLRRLSYTEQNDSALGTQWHTHPQIGYIAEVR